MRDKRYFTPALLLTCLALLLCNHVQGQKQQPEILLPANLKLSLELLSPLSTATNQKGDKFSCKVLSPVEYAGALISGYIRKAKRSGKATGKSEMDLAFDSIVLTDGRSGGFNATVVEVFDVVDAKDQGRADNEGTVKGKSTVKRNMMKIGVGAGLGALIGGIIGGGTGAAIGATIGAGIGVTSTLASKGADLEFKQGTQFTVITNGPSRRRIPSASESAKSDSENPGDPISPPSPPATNPPASVAKTVNKHPEVVNAPVLKSGPKVVTPTAPHPPAPRPPSLKYRPYTGNIMFRLSVPINWLESSTNNPVTFAPNGGHIYYHNKPVLTHGLRVGISPSQERNLQQATEKYLNALLRDQPHLHRQGDYQNSKIAGRDSLNIGLSGLSNVTGREELITVHTTVLRNGDLFYLITVVSVDELSNYKSAFQNILRSIQINDK